MYAHCDNLVVLNEKEELLRDEEHHRNIVERICEALSRIDKAKQEYARLNLYTYKDPKVFREQLGLVSGANADLWLALGVLVEALESQASGHLDPRTVGLTKRWRAAVWDDLTESNENVATHDKVDMYETPKPQGERWIGSWPLGSGTFGSTHLFIQQDENGQICNRVVVKDCDYEKQEIWDQEWFWLKDHRDQDIPVEVKTMSDLRGKIGSEFIVKLLSWRIAKERRLYRLYLEV